jgi:hypothetical protein
MCKSQYDIEVEQQRTRIERKKKRVTMKHLHNHFGFSAAPFTSLSHSS